MKRLNISEADFQSQVMQQASMMGWLCHHTRPALTKSGKWVTAISGDAGFPDCVFTHPHKGTIFVEFKSEKGRVSPHQQRWGDRLVESGAEYYLWRPSDAAEIDSVLARRQRPIHKDAK